MDNEKIEPFLSSIHKKLDGLDRDQLIKHFVYAEFSRFISYYKNARDVNVFSAKKSSRSRTDRKSRGRDNSSKNNFTRFHINIGTKHRLNPLKLISLINESLNSDIHEIGKIEILKTFSFFEIDSIVSQELLETLNETKFNNVKVKVDISKRSFAPSNFRRDKRKGRKNSSRKNKWNSSGRPRKKNRKKNVR